MSCSVCSGPLAYNAISCPKCGYRPGKREFFSRRYSPILIVIFLLIWFFGPTHEEREEELNQKTDYNVVYKHYQNSKVIFEKKVSIKPLLGKDNKIWGQDHNDINFCQEGCRPFDYQARETIIKDKVCRPLLKEYLLPLENNITNKNITYSCEVER
jgi:hypothetical protein